MSMRYITSESVALGHPDKIADVVADSILDAYLSIDPFSRVGCEVMLNTGFVLISGEVSSNAKISIENIVKETIKEIGYIGDSFGLNGNTVAVLRSLQNQSKELSTIVSGDTRTQYIRKASDQGTFIGFAINETPELMPLPITIARNLAHRLTFVREKKIMPYLLPDGKTMVSLIYENNSPIYIDYVIILTQHRCEISHDEITKDIIERVIEPVLPKKFISKKKLKIYVNPYGKFVFGGPMGSDVGITGHNLVRNTYGGFCRINGGSLEGKDPSKIDRCAAYAARYLAKNIVAANIAKRCEVNLSYSIGIDHPISVWIDTYGTGICNDFEISKKIISLIDLRPSAIISRFDLFRPIYKKTAIWGQVGIEDEDFLWEKTDMVNDLKKAF